MGFVSWVGAEIGIIVSSGRLGPRRWVGASYCRGLHRYAYGSYTCWSMGGSLGVKCGPGRDGDGELAWAAWDSGTAY